MSKKRASPIPNKDYIDKTLKFINKTLYDANSLILQTNLEMQTDQILRKKLFEINCKITKMFNNINLIKEIRQKYRIAFIRDRECKKRYEDSQRKKGIKRRHKNKPIIVMPITIKNAKPQVKITLPNKPILANNVPLLANKVLPNNVSLLPNKVLPNNVPLLANKVLPKSVADMSDMCPDNLLDFMYCFN